MIHYRHITDGNKIIETDIFTCKICNKRFLPKRTYQKFCSKKCSKLYWKNKQKEKILSGMTNAWLALRFEVLKRDNFSCQYCGRTAKDSAKLVVDHIYPKAQGGTNNISNLITACNECNSGKKDTLLEQKQAAHLIGR